MRAFVAVALMVTLAVPAGSAAQERLPADAEAAAFRTLAAGIPLGTRVALRTRSGQRLTATLMAADDTRIVVARVSRVPEPPLAVPYGELSRLERKAEGGFNMAKAIGVGLAAGAGAMLTLFAIAVAIDD